MNDYVPPEDVEAPISLTMRTGPGYEAALLTVRAHDAEQLVARLGELQVAEALDKVVEYNLELQKKAGAAAPSAPATQAGPPSQSGGQAPARSSSSASRGAAAPDNGFDGTPHPEGTVCSAPNCGQPVVGKTIKSKKPPFKTYEMWVCPNQRQRNDGHFSEFVS